MSFSRLITRLGLSVVAAAITAEAGSALLLAGLFKSCFYGPSFPRVPAGLLYRGLNVSAGTDNITDSRLHPVLGFMFRPGFAMPVFHTDIERITSMYGPLPAWDWLEHNKTNNFGFFSSVDYPYLRQSKEQYIIGVFGGSVANQFALFGKYALLREFRSRGFLDGREPIVLDFSSGGYKQPQQALALAYFLSLGQEFDLIINVDGFNEAALSRLNVKLGADWSLPSADHLRGLTALMTKQTWGDGEVLLLSRVITLRRTLQDLSRRLQGAYCAALYLVLRLEYDRRLDDFVQLSSELQGLQADKGESYYYVNKGPATIRNDVLADAIVNQWLRSSVLMKALAQSANAKYVHVLQPNQYHSRKTFTDKERRVAVHDTQHGESVRLMYPHMVEGMALLSSRYGIVALDATAVFDSEAGDIYSDDCCHFNAIGEDLLGRFIGSNIPSSTGRRGPGPAARRLGQTAASAVPAKQDR